MCPKILNVHEIRMYTKMTHQIIVLKVDEGKGQKIKKTYFEITQ